MKKVFSIVLAAMMVALLCVSASAAQNTNHIFDFSELTEDESAYVIGGWTCVDTTGLTALGYQLDGGDTVWAVTKCDEVRADNTASVKGENSCYRDTALEGALLQYGLTNGLGYGEFYGYRIYLSIDLTKVQKGDHSIAIVGKFADDTEISVIRDEVVDFTKTVDPKADDPATDAPATQPTQPDPTPSNPDTADVSVIAIAAVACVALAGAVVSKKVR